MLQFLFVPFHDAIELDEEHFQSEIKQNIGDDESKDQEIVEYVEPEQAVGKPLPGSAEESSPSTLLPWQTSPHVLTHLPRLAQCPVCARALAKKKPSRRKPVHVEDEAELVEKTFGVMITADHIVNKHHVDMPQHDKTVALVMLDRGTQWIGAFPRRSRALDQTISACQQVVGPQDHVQLFTSDCNSCSASQSFC